LKLSSGGLKRAYFRDGTRYGLAPARPPFCEGLAVGSGAAHYGGRWNLPGTRVVYCAESRALAALEALVHVEVMEGVSAVLWQATSITIPGGKVEWPSQYPQSWRTYPHSHATQVLGSDWARSLRSVALRVPSAVVPGEFNYLLNPLHTDFTGLAVSPPSHFASILAWRVNARTAVSRSGQGQETFRASSPWKW